MWWNTMAALWVNKNEGLLSQWRFFPLCRLKQMMGHLLEDNANHRAACNAGVDEWPGWALTCRVARPTMQSAGLPSPVLCSGPASFLYPRSRQTATTHMPFPVNSGSFWLWSHWSHWHKWVTTWMFSHFLLPRRSYGSMTILYDHWWVTSAYFERFCFVWISCRFSPICHLVLKNWLVDVSIELNYHSYYLREATLTVLEESNISHHAKRIQKPDIPNTGS